MHARLTLGTLVATCILVLSGCLESDSAGLFRVNGVPKDAPAETGDGDFPVQVQVVQESSGGQPIVGAPVVIFHIPKPHKAPSVHELQSSNASMGGRTGADGVLYAKLTRGQTYSFLAAAPNWTQEARHLVKITDHFKDKPLTIVVFNVTGEFELKGKFPTTVIPASPICCISQSGRFMPTELRLHEDNSSQKQYLYRLRTLTAKISYTIQPGNSGNLNLRAVLFSDSAAPMVFGSSISSGAGVAIPGTYQRTVTFYPWDLANIQAVKNPVLKLAPVAFESIVAPDCIAWSITAQATFDTGAILPANRYRQPYAPDETPQPMAGC